VTRILLIRHARPLQGEERPAAEWPLSEEGRDDARALAGRLGGFGARGAVWASPERRASETATLAFPSMVIDLRAQLREVTKPWYPAADVHAAAAAGYLRGEPVEGWEDRLEVLARMAEVKREAESVGRLVVVSHALVMTTWLDHLIGLDDPVSFWSGLEMPDAWELDLDENSLARVE
jgi:broad specificity phosphatase PhoE